MMYKNIMWHIIKILSVMSMMSVISIFGAKTNGVKASRMSQSMSQSMAQSMPQMNRAAIPQPIQNTCQNYDFQSYIEKFGESTFNCAAGECVFFEPHIRYVDILSISVYSREPYILAQVKQNESDYLWTKHYIFENLYSVRTLGDTEYYYNLPHNINMNVCINKAISNEINRKIVVPRIRSIRVLNDIGATFLLLFLTTAICCVYFARRILFPRIFNVHYHLDVVYINASTHNMKTVIQSIGDICSICLENFEITNSICKTVCGHYFHSHCFSQLIQNQLYKCANCRTSIVYKCS